MDYELWIDDLKIPRVPNVDYLVCWARDIDQAVYYIETFGMPSKLYLDHDLGDHATIMIFLKWLEPQYEEPPPYEVISNNPVGRENIIAFMESWKRSAQTQNPG